MNFILQEKIFEKMSGFILTIIIGFIALWIAKFHKALDPLVIGIVLGIVIRTFLGERHYFLLGFDFAPKFFIPLGIIFYGINLEFHKLAAIPVIFWIQLIIGIILIFLIALYLGRRLGAGTAIPLLIATGTAICGASAIAIATPIVKADSEDTGASLITITIFGLFGMMVYPLVLTCFTLSNTEYAFLCGTTLHQTGFVKLAAKALGDDCLKMAMS
ncbi:MAG: putative sulfate exporter family transporter [bacterium]